MKTYPYLFAGLWAISTTLRGQLPGPDGPPPSAPSGTADASPDAPVRSAEQLEQLLGPIALYPDALIAVILPASTASSDIVLASRFLGANSDASAIDSQPWDESVKSLSRYPEVIKWMDENLEWTKQLGEAFTAQPTDVMNAVQRLRTRARAAGTLTDTPQQDVVMQDNAISIVPADDTTIYVPRYDPDVVYVGGPRSYDAPFITFGLGYAIGSWLAFDCDWGQHRIWVDRRVADNRYHRDFRRPPSFPTGPSFTGNPAFHPWHPTPGLPRPHAPDPQWQHREIVRPALLPATLARPGANFAEANRGRTNAVNSVNAGNPSNPNNPAHFANNGRNRSHTYPYPRTDAASPQPGLAGPAGVPPPVRNAPAGPSAAMPAPGFAGTPPAVTAREKENHNGSASNFRAGSMERPRIAMPAPAVPAERSAPNVRAPAHFNPPAAAPVARSAPSAPAPAASPGSEPNGRDGGRDGGQTRTR